MDAEADDARWFGELLAELETRVPQLAGFFAAGAERVIARAPGRLDVMGGIADYSGSLVLELPLRESALAAAAYRGERVLDLASIAPAAPHGLRRVSVPLSELETGSAATYDGARRYFAGDPEKRWAAYLAGGVLVLLRERGLRLESGLSLLISSAVPEGKGVSSSAAVEVAALGAVAALTGIELEGSELARLCQKAENLVAGAPCGIMDQMTAALGKENHCLLLRCQPSTIVDQLPLPEGVALFGIDSGVRHAVSGADYADVRCGAFMGYRIIAELAGLPVRASARGRVAIDDRRWRGYLANVTPAEFAEFAPRLPEHMTGSEFLDRYQGTTDTVTVVVPGRRYPVREPTAHPIFEHERVRAFARRLGGPMGEAELGELGALMYEAHASYSRVGLGSAATDAIVALVRAASANEGLYGAKITGGGSGGTVAVLARAGAAAAVERIAEHYGGERAHEARVFRGSSNGAALFAIRRAAAR